VKLSRADVADIALGALLLLIGVVGTLRADAIHGERSIDGFGLALVVVAALLVTVRRRWPLGTLLASAAVTSTYLAVGYTYGPILLSFLVSVYTLARYRPLSVSLPAAAASLAALFVHLFTNDLALSGFLGVIPASAWVVVPFAVGVTVRTIQASAAQARSEAIRQRVDDERLRVAQEVHDVVGHGLAAISMQANVALHVLPKDPSQAETALEAISRTSAEALEELRATLATVRRTDGELPRTATPGLAQIEELCGRMRVAGVTVDLHVDGDRRVVPPAVGVAGYRVVQESLTNVLRHGEVAAATVRVGYDDDAVTLTVLNPARHVKPRADGLGLSGMRERVESLGGTFAAGATGDGQFEVRAHIPTGPAQGDDA
jgi:signal transduction histidine kinase